MYRIARHRCQGKKASRVEKRATIFLAVESLDGVKGSVMEDEAVFDESVEENFAMRTRDARTSFNTR